MSCAAVALKKVEADRQAISHAANILRPDGYNRVCIAIQIQRAPFYD
jgi:hypothetical protein